MIASGFGGDGIVGGVVLVVVLVGSLDGGSDDGAFESATACGAMVSTVKFVLTPLLPSTTSTTCLRWEVWH